MCQLQIIPFLIGLIIEPETWQITNSMNVATALCDHATPPIIDKLRSKGVAMQVLYGISKYCIYWKSNKWRLAKDREVNANCQARIKFDYALKFQLGPLTTGFIYCRGRSRDL